MHHQTDTLHPSEFFSIFPTCVGMFDLTQFHPAEEQKVYNLINLDSVEENVLETLPLLKKAINDCIKASISNILYWMCHPSSQIWYDVG